MNKLLAALVISLMASSAFPVTYHVNMNHPLADASNPGTAVLPMRRIQSAVERVSAGDTVLIYEGNYNERVRLKKSGTVNENIVLCAKPGQNVIINGSAVSIPPWGGLLDISECSYVIVDGICVWHSATSGIFANEAQHIIIRNNHTYNTVSSGIGVWNCQHALIYNNDVELACNNGAQECITIANTQHFEVAGNHVHNGGSGTTGGEGIDIKDGCHYGAVLKNHVHHVQRVGIYVDAWEQHTHSIEIAANIVHDCGGFALASEAGGLLENIRIYNNIAYRNRHCGLVIGNWGDVNMAERPIRNIKIINNTFCNNGSEEWGGGINIENPQTIGIVIRNNIFSNNRSFQISDEAGISADNLIIDHNLIDGDTDYSTEVAGTNTVLGTACFVNDVNSDFSLSESSAAIDRGVATDAPQVDFNGKKRPYGTGYDIGAYEFTPDIAIEDTTSELPIPENFELFQNYPNPFNSATTIPFYLQTAAHVQLYIFNISGQYLATLLNRTYDQGFHSVSIDLPGLASGVYVYRLQLDDLLLEKKFTVLR